jgi:hypothetical protein
MKRAVKRLRVMGETLGLFTLHVEIIAGKIPDKPE